MLNSIRKFSKTIYAKILMGVIIIPFVFWGMGDVFGGGSKNTIATINKEKISVQEYINYIRSLNLENVNLVKNPKLFENILSSLIGQKIILSQSQKIGINISDNSLAKIIKNQEIFMKDKKFSRTEYEKFLITNNLNAIDFERNLKKQEIKRLLLTYIGGGVKSPIFKVERIYNDENQSRIVKFLNLKSVYSKNMDFTEKDINDYFQNNKNKFKKEYRTIQYLEINPKNLLGNNEFNDLFFKKLDEIEDLIINETPLSEISEKYKLKISKNIQIDINGVGKDGIEKNIKKLGLIEDIFNIKEKNKISLFSNKNNYFAVQLNDINNILPEKDFTIFKDEIKTILSRKYALENNFLFFKEINTGIFNLNSFSNLSKKNDIPIKIIKINSIKDEKIFNKKIISEIYQLQENSFGVISDGNFKDNYLVYIDKVENKKISSNDINYNQYLLKTNRELNSLIFNTYDTHVNNTSKIVINQNSLEQVKNSYR